MNQNTKTREAYYGREIEIEWLDLEMAQYVGAQVSRAMQGVTQAVMASVDIQARRWLEATRLAERAIAEQWQPDYSVTNPRAPGKPDWLIRCRKQTDTRWHITWPQGQLIADVETFDGALAIIRTIHERAPR